jgi:hypothetical protein
MNIDSIFNIDDIEELYEEMVDEINSIQYSDIIHTNENILNNIFNIRRYIELQGYSHNENDNINENYNIYDDYNYGIREIQDNLQTNFLNSIIEILFGDNLNQNFEDVKVTLTEEEFDNIDNIKISSDNFEKYNERCHICIDEYKIDDVIVQLECKHRFHKKCIKTWLCKENVSCPVCRKDCRNYNKN